MGCKMREARGKYLDNLAYMYGLKRKRFLLFKEKDRHLRKRILEYITSNEV